MGSHQIKKLQHCKGIKEQNKRIPPTEKNLFITHPTKVKYARYISPCKNKPKVSDFIKIEKS